MYATPSQLLCDHLYAIAPLNVPFVGWSLLYSRFTGGTPLADSTSQWMNENRASPRVRTLKGATIVFGVGSTVDCVVRNLSETGAFQALLVSPTNSSSDSNWSRRTVIVTSAAPPTGSGSILNNIHRQPRYCVDLPAHRSRCLSRQINNKLEKIRA